MPSRYAAAQPPARSTRAVYAHQGGGELPRDHVRAGMAIMNMATAFARSSYRNQLRHIDDDPGKKPAWATPRKKRNPVELPGGVNQPAKRRKAPQNNQAERDKQPARSTVPSGALMDLQKENTR